MSLKRHHDMGGDDAGPVEATEHDHALWEKKADAIIRLLNKTDPQLLCVDEMRRGIEELGPGVYDELSYYERWISSATNILIEKGVISIDELGKKMAEVEDRWQKDREQPA